MITFDEFKLSVKDSLERIVKKLVQKLRTGEIIVKKAEQTDYALVSNESILSKNTLLFDNKNLEEVLELSKDYQDLTFEQLSKNLKSFNSTIQYHDSGVLYKKIKSIKYFQGYQEYYKDFEYDLDTKMLVKISIRTNDYIASLSLKNNCKELIRANGKIVDIVYSTC